MDMNHIIFAETFKAKINKNIFRFKTFIFFMIYRSLNWAYI